MTEVCIATTEFQLLNFLISMSMVAVLLTMRAYFKDWKWEDV